MSLPQCKAIVLHGRDAKGNRAGLVPPRHCQRPSTKGDYCGLHAKQAELQDLLRDCMSPMWEMKVRMWEESRRQAELDEGRRVMQGLARVAQANGMHRLASFFRVRQAELAEVWVDAA